MGSLKSNFISKQIVYTVKFLECKSSKVVMLRKNCPQKVGLTCGSNHCSPTGNHRWLKVSKLGIIIQQNVIRQVGN